MVLVWFGLSLIGFWSLCWFSSWFWSVLGEHIWFGPLCVLDWGWLASRLGWAGLRCCWMGWPPGLAGWLWVLILRKPQQNQENEIRIAYISLDVHTYSICFFIFPCIFLCFYIVPYIFCIFLIRLIHISYTPLYLHEYSIYLPIFPYIFPI